MDRVGLRMSRIAVRFKELRAELAFWLKETGEKRR
jgi:hypothetical protein